MKKTTPVLLFLLCTFFSSGFTSTSKYRVGIYDHDSVLHHIPEYSLIMDSVNAFSDEIKEQLKIMEIEFERRVAELDTGSLHWSALILKVKQEDAEALAQRIQDFRSASVDEVKYMETTKLKPLEVKIKVAAESEIISGHFNVILDKDEWVLFSHTTTVTEFTNVTKDMISLVNTKNN